MGSRNTSLLLPLLEMGGKQLHMCDILLIYSVYGLCFTDEANAVADNESPTSVVVAICEVFVLEVVELVLLLIYAWDILLSYLGPKTTYPDIFLWFCWSLQTNVPQYCHKLCHNYFLTHPF
jgi:hypothetical protein